VSRPAEYRTAVQAGIPRGCTPPGSCASGPSGIHRRARPDPPRPPIAPPPGRAGHEDAGDTSRRSPSHRTCPSPRRPRRSDGVLRHGVRGGGHPSSAGHLAHSRARSLPSSHSSEDTPRRLQAVRPAATTVCLDSGGRPNTWATRSSRSSSPTDCQDCRALTSTSSSGFGHRWADPDEHAHDEAGILSEEKGTRPDTEPRVRRTGSPDGPAASTVDS